MMGCFRTVASFAVGRDRGKEVERLFPRGRQSGELQLLNEKALHRGAYCCPKVRAMERRFFSYEAFFLFAAQRFFMSTDSRLRPAAVRW
jgi:hypothetical protein